MLRLAFYFFALKCTWPSTNRMLQQRLSNRDAKKKINLLDFIKLRNKMAATLTCFQHKIKDMAFRRTPLAFPSHDFQLCSG